MHNINNSAKTTGIMKKIVFILILCTFFLTGCQNNNPENNSQVNTSRTLAKGNVSNNDFIISNSKSSKPVIETELGSFSSTIYDKTESRINNIKVACNTLNGTIVPAGKTFSFCDTLGEATPEAGYLPASIYDENGKIFEDYGGREVSN